MKESNGFVPNFRCIDPSYELFDYRFVTDGIDKHLSSIVSGVGIWFGGHGTLETPNGTKLALVHLVGQKL
jgi:hypothetical protein